MQDNEQPREFYSPGQTDNPYASTEQSLEPQENFQHENIISWTASEFIYHEKKFIWYLGLMTATLLTSLIGYLALGRDWYTAAIITLLGIIFGFAAARKPRVLNYAVDDYGLMVDQKHYDYDNFKSFSVSDDNGPITSLVFMPSKRIGTVITIYVPSENLDDVTDIVGLYLPVEDHVSGLADKFLNKIKF